MKHRTQERESRKRAVVAPKVCSVKFSIAITRVFCIMHNEIRNLRERVRRGCAWHKVCDVKILIAIT